MSTQKNLSILLTNDEIISTKKYLKKRVTGFEIQFDHIRERLQLLDSVKCTIDMGESNSILLIGPRGSGKTALINNVLEELFCTTQFQENTVLVNLHGLVHTDDRLSLKDIARQMQLENVVDGKVFGTFAENLNFLIESLKSGDKRCTKPIIFILDEFDLFCGHHNQTLLYNLFDITQSAQTPICVIGITCRLDVIELLEKRVKSRFSHRQIFLYSCQNSSLGMSTSTFDNRLNLFQELLSLPMNKNIYDEDSLCIDFKFNLDLKFRTKWNEQITNLRNHPKVINVIRQMYSNDRSKERLRNFLKIVISQLCPIYQMLRVNDIICASRIFSENEKILMLEGLSILEMCLVWINCSNNPTNNFINIITYEIFNPKVIAMNHETKIYDGETLNFEKVWVRYLKFANQNSSIETVQRPVVIKAFEHIKSLELIIPIGSNQRIEKEYQSYKFSLTSQQVMDAVKKCQGLPTDITRWAESSLI